MKYVNAEMILPDVLTEQLQNYIQGEYLYIPIKKERRKAWGELSGCRKEMNARNLKIKQKYATGSSIEELADIYYLSIHTIKKIIYQK